MNYAEIIFYYTKGQFTISDNNLDYLVWLDPSIPEPTREQIFEWEKLYPIDIAKDNCKTKAQILLNESDWTDLYTVRNKLENINEWDIYRELIRHLRIYPTEYPIFPDKPQTIWKEAVIPEQLQNIINNRSQEPIVNNEETIL